LRQVSQAPDLAGHRGKFDVVSNGGVMQRWAVPIKLFAYLVVVLMLASMGYAAVTAVKYWPAISV
jgi:hypothetical protein